MTVEQDSAKQPTDRHDAVIAFRNQIRETSTGLVIQAPAKLNLYLDVLGRRDDGYHDLETLIVPLTLCDTLRIAPREDGASAIQLRVHDLRTAAIDSSVVDAPLPADHRNLVVSALERLRTAIGATTGLTVDLWKRIPSRAGLGGGSSDAAAALLAGQRFWQRDLPANELLELAAGVGSDVPALLAGGPVVCRGRGERVEAKSLPAGRPCVLFQPPVGLGAGQVFAKHAELGSLPPPANSLGVLVSALRRGNLAVAAGAMVNRLQHAADSLTPWIRRARDFFSQLDIEAHQMSGSGSVYYGLCPNLKTANRAAALLRQRNQGWVHVASTL